MNLIEEFRDRIAVLDDANYNDTTGRLIQILQWLEEEPVTKKVIQDLKKRVNINSLFGEGERPISRNREEIAAVGMHLIEICRIKKEEFSDVCLNLSIEPVEGSDNMQDTNDCGMREYVQPFLRYMEKALLHEAEAFSVIAVAEDRFSQILSGDTQQLLPVTAAHLQRIATEFLRPEKDVAWQNVGNSCRQTLLDFATELRTSVELELPADTKAGDAKAILKVFLAKASAPSRHRDSLESLADSLWNHTASIVHRPATTKIEATRLFLWTGLLVSEFAQLLRSYNEA